MTYGDRLAVMQITEHKFTLELKKKTRALSVGTLEDLLCFLKNYFFLLSWENGQFQTNLFGGLWKEAWEMGEGRRLITICIIDRAACCNLVPTFTVNFYSICSVGAPVPCSASWSRFRGSTSRIYCQPSGIIQGKATGLWLILNLLHSTVHFFLVNLFTCEGFGY